MTIKTNTESETRRLIQSIDEVLKTVPNGFELASSPDFEYYSKALNVELNKFKSGYEKLRNTSFSTLSRLHKDEILDAITKIEELYGISIENKEELLSKIFELNEFSEENFEELVPDEPDIGYAIYNELYLPVKKWKAMYFAELLGVNYNNETEQYLKVVSQEVVYNPSNKPTYSAIHTGAQEIALYVSDLLFENQYQSMLLTLAIVFILLFIQMRSLKIGIIGIIPSMFTVFFNFVLMGIFDIPLNTATISIAAIAIGAGVDYAIHFISRFKIESSKGLEIKDAISRTVFTSGRGILFNALAVSFGFFTFIFSDIKMLREFGALTGITLLLSAFITILFLSSSFLLMKKGGRKV